MRGGGICYVSIEYRKIFLARKEVSFPRIKYAGNIAKLQNYPENTV
jgi:hypothetical protein